MEIYNKNDELVREVEREREREIERTYQKERMSK